jgi:DNA-binding NarL/FixJ family response regulator
VLADLVDVKVVQAGRKVVVLEPDPHVTLELRRAAELPECPCSLKVVRDRLSLQLILKRQRPDVIVVALDSEIGQQAAQELIESHANIVWIGVASNDDQALEVVEQLDGLLRRPFDAEQLFQAINQACGRRDDSACSAV